MKSVTMFGGLPAVGLVVFIVVAGYGAGCSRAPSTTGDQASMQIHYLEIVTKEVDAVCATYSAVGLEPMDVPVSQLRSLSSR